MTRKILVILFSLIVTLNGISQINKHLTPVNPDFINYIKSYDSIKNSAINTDKPLGYIPLLFKLEDVKVINPEGELTKHKSLYFPLPSSYDLRQNYKVSPVKNQGTGASGGNCWAFTAIGSIESDWLVKNVPKVDLSEKNMAACHGYVWKYGDGGNENFAMAYLTGLKGPVKEEDDPYFSSGTSCISGKPVVAYVPEVRWIYNNTVQIKRAIMDYGAVTSRMYWDNSSFRYSDNTYYYNGTKSPNHAVIIVGWDDNITTASGKGAWIVKNSWGDIWADKGFFYISYKDSRILDFITYYPVRWDTGAVNNRTVNKFYSYSELGTISFFGDNNDTGIVVIKYSATQLQYIRKVGTFLARTGSTVDIEIYDDKVDNNLQNLLSHYKSRPVPSPGYYTFDIPTLVMNDFYIKVTYITPGFYAPIPLEIKMKDAADTSEYYANPAIEPSGKQWIILKNKWQPLGWNIKNWESDLVVNAYAQFNISPKANFETDKYEICAGSSVQFTNTSAGNITNYSWDFGSDANPQTATGIGPHTVNFSSSATPGLRYAKLIVSSALGTDSIIKEYKITDRLSILVALPNTARLNDTISLTAFGSANNYTWYPSTDLNIDTGKQVYLKGNVEGNYRYTVSGSQGACSGGITFELELKKSPVNDSICNAIELHTGDNGPFTNEYAGVEKNEPFPTDTCCNCPMTWCDEGGLQNSVWFKVTGPPGGYLNLDTRYIDTQIAIYKSDSCNNIKKEDLIAANDDYHSEEPYSAALFNVPVIPGKIYWVQIDGSGRGSSGTFYITVSVPQVSIEHNEIEKNSFSVIPNPNNGIATLKYSSPYNENVTIRLFDLTGKTVFIKHTLKNSELLAVPLDLKLLPKGLYFVTLRGEKNTLTSKCIIQ